MGKPEKETCFMGGRCDLKVGLSSDEGAVPGAGWDRAGAD